MRMSRHHGGMRTRVGVITAGLALSAAGLAGMTEHARAATCAVVTISPKSGTVLQLDVSAVTVTNGACVRFHNKTNATAIIDVRGTSYRQSVPAGGITTGSENYTATTTATVDAVSALRSGNSTITVRESSPSPSTSPSASATKSPHLTPSPTTSPHVTKSASHSPKPRKHQGKLSLPPLPPLPSGGISGKVVPSNPLVAPGEVAPSGQSVSGTQPVPVATVIEPAVDSKRGLPIAIAAVVLLGLICGYGRAVLSTSGGSDRHRHRG